MSKEISSSLLAQLDNALTEQRQHLFMLKVLVGMDPNDLDENINDWYSSLSDQLDLLEQSYLDIVIIDRAIRSN